MTEDNFVYTIREKNYEDPFFHTPPSAKYHQEHSTAEYVIAFVGILFTCIIMWIMGYVSGVSNGESKAYREMLKSKTITPVESVQEENNNVQ